MFILKPPNIEHKIYVHDYHQTISELDIPLAEK